MMFKKSLLHHERYLQYPRVTSLIIQTAAQILEEKHYFQNNDPIKVLSFRITSSGNPARWTIS